MLCGLLLQLNSDRSREEEEEEEGDRHPGLIPIAVRDSGSAFLKNDISHQVIASITILYPFDAYLPLVLPCNECSSEFPTVRRQRAIHSSSPSPISALMQIKPFKCCLETENVL